MNLSAVISKKCINLLKENTKKDVLKKLIDLVVKKGIVEDKKTLTEKIFYRENLMSTGIGLGIAIPHVRYEGIKKSAIAVGISKEGIDDYQSIDDKTIKIVVMILVGKDQHKEHIKLLSQIVTKLKNNNGIERILKLNRIDEIYSFFLEK